MDLDDEEEVFVEVEEEVDFEEDEAVELVEVMVLDAAAFCLLQLLPKHMPLPPNPKLFALERSKAAGVRSAPKSIARFFACRDLDAPYLSVTRFTSPYVKRAIEFSGLGPN